MSIRQDTQGQLPGLQPTQSPRSQAQEGPALGSVLYCPRFEMLRNLQGRGSQFHVALGHRGLQIIWSLVEISHELCNWDSKEREITPEELLLFLVHRTTKEQIPRKDIMSRV